MAKNRFEQVDDPQPDAITLSLWREAEQGFATVTCPAALAAGRLAADMTSDKLAPKDAFRSAVKLANEIKAAIVVRDPDGLWDREWGDLFRPVD